jgi:hypothetical protein
MFRTCALMNSRKSRAYSLHRTVYTRTVKVLAFWNAPQSRAGVWSTLGLVQYLGSGSHSIAIGRLIVAADVLGLDPRMKFHSALVWHG